ncbi:unnamed protein product [Chrysoparadoxa australica]
MGPPGTFTYPYPRPAVTVDTCIFALERPQLVPQILLIKRGNEPYKGCWALPGGFVDEGETLEAAAARELQEEASVTGCTLVQTGAYGDPGRDPRGHTVSVAYMAFVPDSHDVGVKAADDAAEADWFHLSQLPKLAFDHDKIIDNAWTKCDFTALPGEVVATERGSAAEMGRWGAPSGVEAEASCCSLREVKPKEKGT